MRRPQSRAKLRSPVAIFLVAAAALLLIDRADTRAAGEGTTPGFDPVRQRAEMISLLRSIDARLARLVELQTPAGAEK